VQTNIHKQTNETDQHASSESAENFVYVLIVTNSVLFRQFRNHLFSSITCKHTLLQLYSVVTRIYCFASA